MATQPHGFDFTTSQIMALWESAEHWLENCAASGLSGIQVSGRACACCQIWNPPPFKNGCVGCPIMQFTGQSHCYNTPYRFALSCLRYGTLNEFIDESEREYKFLVCLALGDKPV